MCDFYSSDVVDWSMASASGPEGRTVGRTQNAEPYSMEYPMEYLKWSTPKSHVLVK